MRLFSKNKRTNKGSMLLLMLVFCFTQGYAQLSLFPKGAQAAGMAGIATTETNVWSAFNNQAGLGMKPEYAVGVAYEQRFLVEQLGVSSLAASFPVLGGGLGLSLANTGLADYGENRFGLSYGMRLGKRIAMGAGFNYHLLRFPENYKNPFTITGEIGLIALPLENFSIGVHVFNPTFSKLNTEDYNDVPVIFTLGLCYYMASLAKLYAELQEDMSEYFQARFGTEFNVYQFLAVRAGVLSKPFSVHFGLGYQSRTWHFDFALCKHPTLGYTPQASLSFALP